MAGNYRKARPYDEIQAEIREQELAIKAQEKQEKYMRESYMRVAAEARKQNLWIYDPADNSWYNPDELEATFKWYISGQEKVMARVKLRDPIESLKAGHKKLEEFAERILTYERNKNINLDKTQPTKHK